MHQYTASVDSVSLVGGAAQTVLQLVAPSTRRNKIKWIAYSGNSTTATDAPIKMDIVRQNSAGTSSAGGTPQPIDSADPAALCSTNITFTVEPGTNTSVSPIRFTPIGGTFLWQAVPGDEITNAVSSFTGIRALAPSNDTINVTVCWQE